MKTQSLTVTQPDDWHLHVRSDSMLQTVVPHTSAVFARAIIMPNLVPPITNCQQADQYRQEIISALPKNHSFSPLMTLYLTDHTRVEDIKQASKDNHVFAAKLYPAGVTTNASNGVTSLNKISAVLSAMEKYQLPLLVHGEVTTAEVDIFDREKVFIDQHLSQLVQDYPGLKIVFEHITTADAVDFVLSQPDTVAATITAHHLLLNRNAMLAGGIRPHYYCLPVLKRESHRKALVRAATSGSHKFFLGTDSAPHGKQRKESSCGCAGSYTAYHALPLYAEAFDAENALDKLEQFSSFSGADFYGLPRNNTTVRLIKTPWTIPESFQVGSDEIIPFHAGQTLNWKIEP
jgi:dihydroorotase